MRQTPYLTQGQIQESLVVYHALLEEQEEVIGPLNIITLQTIFNLGRAYNELSFLFWGSLYSKTDFGSAKESMGIITSYD